MSVNRREMLALTAGCAACAMAPRLLEAGGLQVGQRIDGTDLPAQEASWYKKLGESRVECQLCPQGCKVADAERGTCGVRENRGGTYMTLVHGVACSVHVDPIEKKPFFHVLPGEQAFSFATAGCNVECKFCQNWEISQFRPEQVQAVYLPPKELAAAAKRNGVRLTAATYSEPVVFWEYVRDSAKAAREVGLRTAVVSNGFIQEQPLKDVLPLLDAVKVDLKSFREEFYRDLVRGKLEPVLKSLETIRASGVWLEIVVLLVPTHNDTTEEIRDLARWVKTHLGAEVPVHFTRFHPIYRLTELPPTPVATLERAWQVAREEGLEYVYLGNVAGHPGENTVCPSCKHALIQRSGFQILGNALVDGHCPSCKRKIPGVWG